MRGEYIQDIERIAKICAEKGLYISLEQASDLWQEYSDSMCAGWMNLPENNDVVFDCLDIKKCSKCGHMEI